MKHLEVRQKYSAARRIFNSLLGVSSGDETLHLMFDILRIRNGCLFCRKMAYKRGKGLNLGAEPPPDKTFLSTPGLGFHQSAINSGNGAAWGSILRHGQLS